MNYEKRELLYQGKAKSLYATAEKDVLWSEFRNDTTAFDGAKKAALNNKGQVNNLLSAHFMQYLAQQGIATHFIKLLSPQVSLVHRLQMLPLEAVVRNIAAGSLCRRLGIAEKTQLQPPLYEIFLKNDELHDPLVTEQHAIAFAWATAPQLQQMQHLALKIHAHLTKMLAAVDLVLVDAKYEFGMRGDQLCLGDEISPDSCRIWDAKTGRSLDKDRFRKDLGQVVESYEEIARRLGVAETVKP